jgi:hypothetical protein
MIECVLNYSLTYARKRIKLEKGLWYQHVSNSIETSREGKVTILWNQRVQTLRTIPDSKADIVIHNNEKGTCCNFRR